MKTRTCQITTVHKLADLAHENYYARDGAGPPAAITLFYGQVNTVREGP